MPTLDQSQTKTPRMRSTCVLCVFLSLSLQQFVCVSVCVWVFCWLETPFVSTHPIPSVPPLIPRVFNARARADNKSHARTSTLRASKDSFALGVLFATLTLAQLFVKPLPECRRWRCRCRRARTSIIRFCRSRGASYKRKGRNKGVGWRLIAKPQASKTAHACDALHKHITYATPTNAVLSQTK